MIRSVTLANGARLSSPESVPSRFLLLVLPILEIKSSLDFRFERVSVRWALAFSTGHVARINMAKPSADTYGLNPAHMPTLQMDAMGVGGFT
eukprot:5510846-Pyramimonas_sp.AAC.1